MSPVTVPAGTFALGFTLILGPCAEVGGSVSSGVHQILCGGNQCPPTHFLFVGPFKIHLVRQTLGYLTLCPLCVSLSPPSLPSSRPGYFTPNTRVLNPAKGSMPCCTRRRVNSTRGLRWVLCSRKLPEVRALSSKLPSVQVSISWIGAAFRHPTAGLYVNEIATVLVVCYRQACSCLPLRMEKCDSRSFMRYVETCMDSFVCLCSGFANFHSPIPSAPSACAFFRAWKAVYAPHQQELHTLATLVFFDILGAAAALAGGATKPLDVFFLESSKLGAATAAAFDEGSGNVSSFVDDASGLFLCLFLHTLCHRAHVSWTSGSCPREQCLCKIRFTKVSCFFRTHARMDWVWIEKLCISCSSRRYLCARVSSARTWSLSNDQPRLAAPQTAVIATMRQLPAPLTTSSACPTNTRTSHHPPLNSTTKTLQPVDTILMGWIPTDKAAKRRTALWPYFPPPSGFLRAS